MLARLTAIVLLGLAAFATPAAAAGQWLDGMVHTPSQHDFATLRERLKAAVENHEMFVLGFPCASCFAAKNGVKIPGNSVLLTFHQRFALPMLETSVQAGYEAPMRFYVTENDDGTATLSYRKPSAVWAGYNEPKLDKLAAELDGVFASIAKEATGS